VARTGSSVVYLDTHIVVWLYAGLTEKLTEPAKSAMETSQVLISQMVRLELQYLYEINRIKAGPPTILNSLAHAIDLKVSDSPLNKIIDISLKTSWTRDVFDRLITAEAILVSAGLITADRTIRTNFKQAIW
jgi:PIN domain nuclease of toxin-antitoxin system